MEKEILNFKIILSKLKEDYNFLDSKFIKVIEEKNKIEVEIFILKYKFESKSYNMVEIEN